MKTIQLTKGFVAIVDDEDFAELAQYHWFVNCDGYAIRSKWMRGQNRSVSFFMHHAIIGRKDGFQVDHKNGDRRDNRRENLRFATHAQNCHNSRGKGGVKGVRKIGKTFSARIYANGKHVHLGTFKTEAEAASAYIAASINVHGEFSRFN